MLYRSKAWSHRSMLNTSYARDFPFGGNLGVLSRGHSTSAFQGRSASGGSLADFEGGRLGACAVASDFWRRPQWTLTLAHRKVCSRRGRLGIDITTEDSL
mmetsp:Transcript_829/g.2736  ORF Transcript_829/g.2736 Transcript_829/m.2736 type:complete len:100 (+) Transcript_829:98-397(+)